MIDWSKIKFFWKISVTNSKGILILLTRIMLSRSLSIDTKFNSSNSILHFCKNKSPKPNNTIHLRLPNPPPIYPHPESKSILNLKIHKTPKPSLQSRSNHPNFTRTCMNPRFNNPKTLKSNHQNKARPSKKSTNPESASIMLAIPSQKIKSRNKN